MSSAGGTDLAWSATGPRDGPLFVWAHALLSSREAEDEARVFDWSSSAAVARWVRYDARGHGASPAGNGPAAYRWPRLADDMVGVADAAAAKGERFVAGGASMGCGAALWVAVSHPERVTALVLAIPPTAWGTRPRQAALYRAGALTVSLVGMSPFRAVARLAPAPPAVDASSANQLLTGVVDRQVAADVLRGAADSDFPPADRLHSLPMPTLILAWRGDSGHPLSTARRLADVLPHAELLVASSPADVRSWPSRVTGFLAAVPRP